VVLLYGNDYSRYESISERESERMIESIGGGEGDGKMRIAIVNQKGGVGKTTTAINLAACLAEQDRVLVVDLDPQGNATMGLGIQGDLDITVADLLLDKAALEEVIIETEIENLSLIPADIGLAGLDFELNKRVFPQTLLQRKLADIDYDWVLFDCPPSLGLFTLNALVDADGAIVPVRPAAFSLKGLEQLMDVIREVQEAANADLKILGILITDFDTRTKLAHQALEYLNESLKSKVFKTVINRNVRIEEAQGHGLSILEYDAKSKGARDYISFAQEVRNIG